AVQRRVARKRCVRLSRHGICRHCTPRSTAAVLAPLYLGRHGQRGFRVGTGIEALHAQSDLDLILRVPRPLDRSDARDLLATLDKAVCVVDMQLQTPLGAVALREWAGPSRQVLLKTASGARLVLDPWRAAA
ncbi:phosphoribosyl-dephospho-CoA transferase, partial [Pseudomonas cedrina subsp. fulgida]|nr:phosphoribosyl-dephospho-CoA transferase [Pseudomonas cedrina subsp. fulgida]